MRATGKRRWVRRVLIGTAAALLIGAGATVYLLRKPPAIWVEAQEIIAQTTPEERAAQAEAVRQRLSAMASAGSTFDPTGVPGARQALGQDPTGPLDQTHELHLTNEELVAVVSDTFGDWTAQRGYEVPDAVTEPIVLADNGQLALAFEVSTPSWSQVFSGHVELTFRPDGMAVGRVDQLTAGSLPVSVNAVGEMLREQLPAGEKQLADRIGEWLSQLEGFEFRPVLELENRRRARVMAMRVGADDVTLTMRVQDHVTYRHHNTLLAAGRVAVTDALPGAIPGALPAGTGFADVPTQTD